MIAFIKRRKTALLAVLVVVSVIYLLFFHTFYGLAVQWYVSQHFPRSPYARFLASRLMVSRDVRLREQAAIMLMEFGGEDLYEAQQVWNSVIAEKPDARSYSWRASTYVYQGRYTNAVADFEQAIRLWNPLDMTGDFSIRNASNGLETARACAQIRSNQTARAK